MKLNEKASYIKGLCDGMELDTASKEGKVIAALLDLVAEMAEAIEYLDAEVGELGEYIEEVDEDLEAVEDELYGEDEE